MDEEAFEAVVAAVRERVVPDGAERERLERVADEVQAAAREAVADLPVAADVLLVGSTARRTWLAGVRDVDVFVRFPPDLDREELEEYGLQVGHAVLPDGREEFAEHPYVTGVRDGVDVDLVPCYDVESPADIRSAVDRTPFHTAYVEERLTDELADEVRVTKAFLAGADVYGSDLRTRGFSGYLTELLVLEYGGFRPLVEAVADWHPPVRIDPANHGRREFEDDLVVVDPTDPERNVAAALSRDNLARLVHYARELLSDPRESLFERDDPEPLSGAEVQAAFRKRETHPVALRFPAPDVVDDQLYPQLDKSLAGVAGELDRRGFDVLRAARFADETAVLFCECEVAERPAVERHEGPPVGVRDHAESFYETYRGADVYGPFVDEGRYVVERERDHRTPESWLASDDLRDVALGPDVERELDDREVLAGEDVAAVADEFGIGFARYFDPRP